MNIAPSKAMADTDRVIAAGRYKHPVTGRGVRIAKPRGTDARLFTRATAAQGRSSARGSAAPARVVTEVEVTQQTSLEAAARYAAAPGGGKVLVLDFASPSNPGGSARSDQQGTQEETLCRCSTLLPSLENLFDEQLGGMPNDGCFLVDNVCVFKYDADDPGGRYTRYAYREAPFRCGIVAAAMVQGLNLADTKQRRMAEEKWRLVLDSFVVDAAADTLVAGAWGCGAFGNDAGDMAQLVRDLLGREYGLGKSGVAKGGVHEAAVETGKKSADALSAPVTKRVVFAVPGKRHAAFARVFQ